MNAVPLGKAAADLQMSPVLPHSLEGSVLKAQLQLESNHDTAAMATFSEKVRAWSEVWTLSDSAVKGHEANAQTVIKGEDGVERPCCAFMRPLQLGRSAHSSRAGHMQDVYPFLRA